jgi:hypothetical protein
MRTHESYRFVLSIRGTTPHYCDNPRKAARLAAEFRAAGYDVYVIDRADPAAGTDYARKTF